MTIYIVNYYNYGGGFQEDFENYVIGAFDTEEKVKDFIFKVFGVSEQIHDGCIKLFHNVEIEIQPIELNRGINYPELEYSYSHFNKLPTETKKIFQDYEETGE